MKHDNMIFKKNMYSNSTIMLLPFFASLIFNPQNCNPCLKEIKTQIDTNIGLMQKDTIQGYFFYEVDIPEKCYSRFDQIEQGKSIIFFDSLALRNDIEKLYSNGVLIFNYQPLMQKTIKDFSFGAIQNKLAINNFIKEIDYLPNIHDSAFINSIYHDDKNILSYKKIYAKLIVGRLGNQNQLIPSISTYTCCYSNRITSLNTFFIIDILNFSIY